MAAYEQESDVIQWGLSLLEATPPYYSGYYGGDSIQNDPSPYHHHQNHHDGGHYNVADHYDISDNTHVENDEIIARTLQEDFSHLAVTNESSSAYSHDQGGPQPQDYYAAGDWPNTSSTSYLSSEHDEESDDMGSLSPCSIPSPSPSCGDEQSYSDDYGLDDEVGKRLNHLIPIRHVPKINGEMPSLDEVTSDHERLLNRLQAFGFVEVKVQGDGNCQFRALSDQLYATPDRHKTVRRAIVTQLKSNPEMYEGYVPMTYREYLKNMSRSGEWGDHVTLQAAADSYGVKVLVMTSFKDTYYIEILPQKQKPKGVILLSFWAEVHYNSIYFHGDSDTASPEPNKKKKRRWIFGKKH